MGGGAEWVRDICSRGKVHHVNIERSAAHTLRGGRILVLPPLASEAMLWISRFPSVSLSVVLTSLPGFFSCGLSKEVGGRGVPARRSSWNVVKDCTIDNTEERGRRRKRKNEEDKKRGSVGR